MASGLDNLFTTFGQEHGALGAYQAGQRRGLADTATNLANEKLVAETQRYTGETPSYLRKSEAGARTAELANVQGEADLAAGVPDAKAGQNYQEARQKAQQAEAEFNNWPAKHKIALIDQTAAGVEKFNNLGIQLLQFSGSTNEAIQRMAETYPDMAKDPKFTEWAQKYGGMPREQALNAFKFEMQKYASGIATTREKFQAEALAQDQEHMQDMEKQQLVGQQGIAEASIRAAGDGNKPIKQNAAEIVLALTEQYKQALAAGDKAAADQILWQINAVKNTKPDEESFAGLPAKPGTQVKPLGAQGSASDIPAAKIMKLQQDPSPKMRKFFDDVYGEGAAAKVLGK